VWTGGGVIDVLIGNAVMGSVTVSTAPGATWAMYSAAFDIAPALAGTRQDFSLGFGGGCTGDDCTVFVDLVTMSALARGPGGALVCAAGA